MKTMKNDKKGGLIDLTKARILVTGGSGSLGKQIIKILLDHGAKNIISISRDENLIKQAETEIDSPNVSFQLGDITDEEQIIRMMKETDIVFHTAAIKHVSLAEENPRAAHRVNVLGLLNLLNAEGPLKRFVHISTDKVIGVVNCYGSTKLLAEYLVKESNRLHPQAKHLIIRCPNFFASRGSVLDVWRQQLRRDNTIRLTDPEMTRYFINLPEAAKFAVETSLRRDADPDTIYYPLKYTSKFLLKDLAEMFIEVFGNSKTKIKVLGTMPGEKKHEDYISDVPLMSRAGLKKLLIDFKNKEII